MTKKKSAKRAFISSFMSFIMCFAMLAGTTFAWYTDSVTSSGNKIIAGSLDIELWKYEPDTSVEGRDAEGYVNISESGAPIFQSANLAQNSTATLWEPGKTQVAYLKIKNNGDLALKYSVAIDVRNIAKDLYKVMKYAIVPDATQAVGVSSWTGIPAASVTSVVPGTNPTGFSDITMPKEAVHAFALVIHMDEEAGNEYMAGEVDFDLRVLATQEAYEADSFGTDYDANAEYPVISTSSVTMTGAATEALEIQSVGEIKSASVPAAAANTVFEAMKDGEAESNDLTLTLNVAKTGETTTAAGTTVALEIDMTAVMEKTKAGVTTTTKQGVTEFSDFITIQYDLGTGLSNVTATHKGNAMVNSTNTAEDAGNGIYSYDSATGILTIKTTKLSPFAVSYVLEGQGTAVALTAETVYPITLTAPINGSTASVSIKEHAIASGATELKLTIQKSETTVFGRNAYAYTFNVSGLSDYATFDLTFPCSFDKDAGDTLYAMNARNTMDITSYVGQMVAYGNGALTWNNFSSSTKLAVAYADPAEAEMVDLKDIQTILSVNGTTIQANDENAKGDTVKSRGASITADNFTLKDLHVLTETTSNGGLFVKGNGTTIDNSVFDARWLGSYADTIKIQGSNTTVRDTTIAHYQTSQSNGRYAGLELTTDTATSVTTIDNVTFKGMDGLLFRSFAGRINITNSVFDVSNSAIQLNMDSGPNTGSAYIKGCTIKAKQIGFMRVKNGVTFENTTFETPNGTGSFTIKTGDNVTTNILFKDCTFKNELTFPGSTTTGFKTVLTFENCTYLGEQITEDNIQSLFNFSVNLTTYHVVQAYNGTTLTITVAAN